MIIQTNSRPVIFVFFLCRCLASASLAFAQSTGAIQGTVTDAAAAVVPDAVVTVRDPAHGVSRTQATDSAGIYYVPSLPVGIYEVDVKAAKQDFALTVASSTQVLDFQTSAPPVDTDMLSKNSLYREIPLNARHFVDLPRLDGKRLFLRSSDTAHPMTANGGIGLSA